jgi:hypothetical protein
MHRNQKSEVDQWCQTELLFALADFNTVKNNANRADVEEEKGIR